MIRRVYSSYDIPPEEKEQLLNRIREEDKSDWTEKTQAFCEAAIPNKESKEAVWNKYFDFNRDWSYNNLNASL